MKLEPFNRIVKDTVLAIANTLVSKGKEYCVGDDRLYNFKEQANIDHITVEAALWGNYRKHLVSVMDLKNGNIGCNVAGDTLKKLIDEKIGDSINYHILLKAVLYERYGIE